MNASDVTVIYYTANRERPNFERRVKLNLLSRCQGMPLISVSHKPIALGENICVGKMEVCGKSAIRQLQIGVEAAKTRYVCTAEADCLYPPEYFQFQPTLDDTFYLTQPIWVLFSQRRRGHYFARKSDYGEMSAMHVNREFLLDRLAYIFREWGRKRPRLCIIHPRDVKRELVHLQSGMLTFKTDQNMHRFTTSLYETRTQELPFWGSATQLINQYLGPIP